ncbi:glycoside hydrolase family 27 protein [Paludibaculum fermentans]|uniref:glycoside hydrolase family 27 protein n=1 Tax=Paludibaculum fermentans TaxID=1473598 RepID=UPI003EBCE914
MSAIKLLVLPCVAALLHAQAPTPPMGWNSWDCYGTTVTEDEVKANAEYMAKHLAAHGWKYIVVDIQWSDAQAKAHGYRANAELNMDGFGRLLPAENRFPSSGGGEGFKPLADAVHKLGLKFGIHIMRGIPRQAVRGNTPIQGTRWKAEDVADKSSICQWNTDMYGVDVTKEGGQEYYDSIVKLYAGWGVDFIKADDMARPLHAGEIEALDKAIRKSGRPMVLSLSPGPADVKQAAFYAAHAQMWRVSDDFWDRWVDLKKNFDLMAPWSGHSRENSWPDGDMLPLGRIGIRAERGDDRRSRFTPVEQQTLMSLWAIARSPMMFGGDLPSNDPATLALITNDEVLAVNQKGSKPRELFRKGEAIAWVSDAADGKSKYLAVFHSGEGPTVDVRVDWTEIGLSGTCVVRDLWKKADTGRVSEGQTFSLSPHASGLYRITPVK